jgi:hypothetical protein
MKKPDQADVRRVHVRVNGITFESVRVRHDLGSRDFDIVIDDPQVGRFALTAAVPSLELHCRDEQGKVIAGLCARAESQWRRSDREMVEY